MYSKELGINLFTKERFKAAVIIILLVANTFQRPMQRVIVNWEQQSILKFISAT